MAETYQSSAKKFTKKFEVMGSKEVAVRLPLPLVEVWEEVQPEVEHLTRTSVAWTGLGYFRSSHSMPLAWVLGAHAFPSSA
jgi:hypothetical protein